MHKGPIKAAFLPLLAAILFSACTKIDTTDVGAGLIPGVDNIHTFDTTLNIIATNYDNSDCDSVSSLDLHALGVIDNNPLFGKANANIYLELKPADYPFTLPEHDDNTLVLDSVVMVLKYDHSYGDTTIPQHVGVYELALPMDLTTAYKTCDELSYNDKIGEATFTPGRLEDSIHSFREDDNNELRINLDNNWGQAFLNNVQYMDSDSSFKLLYSGFAIIADKSFGGQALNYFNLNSSATRLSFYIRSSRDTVKDTSVVNLTFNPFCAQANYVHVDRNGSEITQHLAQPAGGDSVLYIQTTPGSYALLKIPSLSTFPNCVINRAELIADQIYEPASAIFQVPRQLFLETEDPANPGNYKLVPCDFSMNELQTGFSYFGGQPKNNTDGSGNTIARYTFNISRYIQSIVTRGAPNSTLKLSAPFYIQNLTAYTDTCDNAIQVFYFNTNNIGEGGVKLEGTDQAPTRIRLRIVYSKLN